MKIRKAHAEQSGVDIQMTPMIDIVFQLLAFFIMTFKVVAMEGDFNIKMPVGSVTEGAEEEDVTPVWRVGLRADTQGNLREIDINGNVRYARVADLHNFFMEKVGDDPVAQEETEIEFDCDYNLRYEETIRALTAVSGERTSKGIKKLVQKIKFTPPRKPG